MITAAAEKLCRNALVSEDHKGAIIPKQNTCAEGSRLSMPRLSKATAVNSEGWTYVYSAIRSGIIPGTGTGRKQGAEESRSFSCTIDVRSCSLRGRENRTPKLSFLFQIISPATWSCAVNSMTIVAPCLTRLEPERALHPARARSNRIASIGVAGTRPTTWQRILKRFCNLRSCDIIGLGLVRMVNRVPTLGWLILRMDPLRSRKRLYQILFDGSVWSRSSAATSGASMSRLAC